MKGLFKVMSYKDEYEVARLHTQTGFYESLRARFEGDFKVRHHMAPPFLTSKRDARGRPTKRAFGPWMQSGLKALSRMKGLRGTPFDPFGYTAERRMERRMIDDYRAVLDRLLAGLTANNRDEAARIAAMILEVRGYGPVKEQSAKTVQGDIDRALSAAGL